MNRRDFFFNSIGLTTLVAPTISLAYNDYSKDYDLYRRKYVYEPNKNLESPDPLQFLDSMQEENKKQIVNDILPFTGKEKEAFWNQPRKIFIKRTTTGEQSEIVYFANGKLHPQNYWLASYLLRDVRDKKMTYIDPKLLDLMSAVQAWLNYFGVKQPLHINSGFRTNNTNNRLEGAAKNSMHLHGKAVDFFVPKLNVKDIAAIAAQFKAGGLGLYLSSGFIHLDTGGVRTWVRR